MDALEKAVDTLTRELSAQRSLIICVSAEQVEQQVRDFQEFRIVHRQLGVRRVTDLRDIVQAGDDASMNYIVQLKTIGELGLMYNAILEHIFEPFTYVESLAPIGDGRQRYKENGVYFPGLEDHLS
jgi:hypothetical protein